MTQLIHSVLKVPPRKIAYIHSDESVKKCIDMMTDMDIGALVVVGQNNELIGIVSERDIIRLGLHKGLNMKTAKVSDVVCPEISILTPHDFVEKAMQVMTETKRRHILIKEKGDFIAILSIGDLLYYLLEDKARVIEQLENYIHT